MNAKPSERRRERGFSLIEAIIVVAITALLATMLFSLTGRATSQSFEQAGRLVDAVEAANAEYELRLIFASSHRAVGGDAAIDAATSLASDNRCVDAGGERTVRVYLDGSSLVCESRGKRRTLLRWRRGEARFAYSASGAWADAWAGSGPALVRFTLIERRRVALEWTMRLGEEVPRAGAEP
jgi:prepilin-type N-terminal cleavage/methylation domain-containing protein